MVSICRVYFLSKLWLRSCFLCYIVQRGTSSSKIQILYYSSTSTAVINWWWGYSYLRGGESQLWLSPHCQLSPKLRHGDDQYLCLYKKWSLDVDTSCHTHLYYVQMSTSSYPCYSLNAIRCNVHQRILYCMHNKVMVTNGSIGYLCRKPTEMGHVPLYCSIHELRFFS